MKDEIIDDLVGLCAYCKNRFRRVLKPGNINDYIEDGVIINDIEDHIIVDTCIIIPDMFIGNDITIECNHYEQKEDNTDADSVCMRDSFIKSISEQR